MPGSFEHHRDLPTTKETVPPTSAARPSLWSPFGDVTLTSASTSGRHPVDQPGGLDRQHRRDGLSTASATDPARIGHPRRVRVVVTVKSGATRDIGLLDQSLPHSANPAFNAPAGTPTPLGFANLDAHDPVVSNDGTLAFVGTVSGHSVLYVAEQGTGPIAVADLGDVCAGQRPTFSSSGHSLAFVRSSGGCAASELVVLDKVNGTTFAGATEHQVVTSGTTTDFASASWRAKTPAARSTRLGGSDRVATSIAASRDQWPDTSRGAILASSAAFPDALVAGPLSGATGTPLLLNPVAQLDSRVLAELKRLMPAKADRAVYVIGGTSSISAATRKSLAANGFVVTPLAGTDRFRTSVRVAQEIDKLFGPADQGPPRTTAFLADGMTFPDALSAGPAASVLLAPVLLTNGSQTPAVVKSYVDGRTSIRTVNAVGRSASSAVNAFGSRAGARIIGSDRYETSAMVARQWFPGAMEIGYANGLAFPDAVTGGALMSSIGQPLMLVPPTSLPSSVGAVASTFRAATDEVILFGGTSSVSDAVRDQVRDRAGTQTAMWGPDVKREPNPMWPQSQRATSPAGKGLSRTGALSTSPSQRAEVAARQR